MIPKLPTYAKGDSIGIAVCPTGVSLDEVEIDMLVYTTGNGPRIYGSTQGRGLPIVKGADRAVFNIPSSETRKLDAGIVTLETTYTVKSCNVSRTLIDRILILKDPQIVNYNE
jgi:hypothetical protein